MRMLTFIGYRRGIVALRSAIRVAFPLHHVSSAMQRNVHVPSDCIRAFSLLFGRRRIYLQLMCHTERRKRHSCVSKKGDDKRRSDFTQNLHVGAHKQGEGTGWGSYLGVKSLKRRS